ncbi:redoxin family protein [bacterium]|nr:redoxin family protein [bacterium]
MTAKEGIAMGDKAPMTDVKMKNATREGALSIADVKGDKGTLVIFSCNHCPYVVAWEDRIAQIGNSYMKKGFGVIAINSNDPATYPSDGFDHMVTRAKEKGFEFPYVVDATSDVARAYGAERTPEVFLFNADDELVYHGAVDDNSENADMVEKTYLKDALDAVLAGREVPMKETKAIGCSIKFRKSD